MGFDHQKLNSLVHNWVQTTGQTQTKLGELTGVKSDLSNYKTGRKTPGAARVKALEDYFKVPSGYFEIQDAPKPEKVSVPVKSDSEPAGSVQTLKDVADRAIAEWSIDNAEIIAEPVSNTSAPVFSFVDILAGGELLLKSDEGEFYRATRL
jgi:transcriptional regulator with XRE-family HTH domain